MGPEFLLAFQTAKLALAGIRSCVEMLSEGKAEIQRVKKTIEQGVGDAKAIYSEVTGIWSWLQGLFGIKPAAKAVAVSSAEPKPAEAPAPAKAAAADEYEDHIPDEDEVVEQFLTHFSNFVEAQTTILDAIAEKRDEILNVWNPKQNNRKVAVELIRYERRINDMAMELSELMAAGPRRLGSVRDEFKEKLDIVIEAQSRARDAHRRKQAKASAEQWQRRSDRIDVTWTWVWSGVLVLYFWTFMGLVWLNMTTTQ